MLSADIRGRLAADPETSQANDTTVTRLRVIVDQTASERERDDPAVGVNVEAWAELGGQLAQLRKGDPVVLLGNWKRSSWKDQKTGEPRHHNFVRVYAGGPDLSRCEIDGLRRRSASPTPASSAPAPASSAPAEAAAPAAEPAPAAAPPAVVPTAAGAAPAGGPVDPFDEE